jgi:hypothetical protein
VGQPDGDSMLSRHAINLIQSMLVMLRGRSMRCVRMSIKQEKVAFDQEGEFASRDRKHFTIHP